MLFSLMFEVINLTSSVKKTEELNEENTKKELWLKFSKAGELGFFQINNSLHLRRKYAPIFARGH